MNRQSNSEQRLCLVGLLRECRQAAQLTQIEVAARLHCTQSDVSKVERGVLSLDVLELRRWVAAVDSDFETFIAELERRLSSLEKLSEHWSRPLRAASAKRARR
jgi:transcriptional regulator with XRE-family HTH domain